MAAALAVLLAATLHLTLPAFDADTSAAGGHCAPGPTACGDLDSLIVWAQVRWNPRAFVLYRLSVRGRAGETLDLPIPLDSVATVWAATRDTAGNWACASRAVGVNLVAGVEPTAAPPKLEWFDVAGRRLHEKPTAPGVYFWRRGREKGVRVVLR